jgi:hypothetical protein
MGSKETGWRPRNRGFRRWSTHLEELLCVRLIAVCEAMVRAPLAFVGHLAYVDILFTMIIVIGGVYGYLL